MKKQYVYCNIAHDPDLLGNQLLVTIPDWYVLLNNVYIMAKGTRYCYCRQIEGPGIRWLAENTLLFLLLILECITEMEYHHFAELLVTGYTKNVLIVGYHSLILICMTI